jgi:hypothetical protein
VAIQAELTTLRVQFQLAPNLKKAVGAKDDDKAGGKKEGGGDNKKQNNKKNNTNKKERREMKTGRRHLPSKEML